MRNIILPEGMASVTVFEQTYTAKPDGSLRDLDDHVAREMMSHDPRIREFAVGSAEDPGKLPGAEDGRVRLLARIGGMDRTELFATARALEVSVPATFKTEAMREIVLRHAAAAPADKIPLVVGGDSRDDGDITILTPEDAASANRGNDGLGTKPGIHTAAGGATFSSGTFAGTAAAPPPPAPSGLGPVQLTGTQQPPLNQLNTVTGQPAHDAGAAPFPISVPPLDPATNLPYREGDPRIPVTAMPIARVLTPDQHDAVDAHESKAAATIRAASEELSASVAGDRPLLSDTERAGREVAAAAAASQDKQDAKTGRDADPNHGNQAEGEKPKTAAKS